MGPICVSVIFQQDLSPGRIIPANMAIKWTAFYFDRLNSIYECIVTRHTSCCTTQELIFNYALANLLQVTMRQKWSDSPALHIVLSFSCLSCQCLSAWNRSRRILRSSGLATACCASVINYNTVRNGVSPECVMATTFFGLLLDEIVRDTRLYLQIFKLSIASRVI